MFIHLSVDEHLGCLHFGAMVNNDAVSIYEWIFVWAYVFSSFGYIPKSGIPGSYGNFVLNLLRSWQIVFQSDCPIFLSYQQWLGILNFPHPWQYFFLITAILVGVKCLIIQILIYLSLTAVDIEHFFVCNYWLFMFFKKEISMVRISSNFYLSNFQLFLYGVK